MTSRQTSIDEMRNPTLSILKRRAAAQAVGRSLRLPCGCLVPYNLGVIMRWLLSAKFLSAYDCIHTEAFVRRHLKRGSKCA